MRKICVLTALLLLTALAGCGRVPAGDAEFSVVSTIFPQYDWVRQILGDRADNMELTLLLGDGIDLHSYQPTVEDIAKISECDMFIYVGGESDLWIADALEEVTNPDMIVINLLEATGDAAKTEELVEGMQEDEHDHGDEEDHEEDHEGDEHEEDHEGEDHEEDHVGEEVLDEHVWLSLKNAETLCIAIADALSDMDAGHADTYKANLETYLEKLQSMDGEYRSAADGAAVKTLLFGDRFPFRYLVDDYALSYFAAFPGCSAETEASFDTIAFLTEKLDELSLKNVMVIESSDQSIANTIIRNSAAKDQKILVLDAMQSVTDADVSGGATYLSIMESNLGVLKEALS